MLDCVASIDSVSKAYKLYVSPRDRLKEALHPLGKKYHRDFYALKNITLDVQRGEILGIIGRNGSGKSTLLKIISGVLTPSTGKVTVEGRISVLLDVGSGMNPDFTGIQNIIFGGVLRGFSRQEMQRRLDDIVSFADIGDFIHQPLRTYSSGMKARLGFALATYIEPQILIVDEVLAVGDNLFHRKCFSRMEALLKSGCTVLFVSHSTQSINELCTRAVLLDGGELLLSGPPMLVTTYYQKLLFAAPDKVQQTRREIVGLQADEARKQAQVCVEEPSAMPLERRRSIVTQQKPLFLPDLLPKSTKVQRNDDIDIANLSILTALDERVNVLLLGESYRVSFETHFRMRAESVSVGVVLKSTRGLNLCSRNLAGEYIPLIEVGQKLLVDFHFKCLLAPGTYYVSVGVYRERDGNRAVMQFIHDALAFRVEGKKEKNIGGLLYCDQRIATRLE